MKYIERLILSGVVLAPIVALGCDRKDEPEERDPAIESETRPLSNTPAARAEDNEIERTNEPSTNKATAVVGANSEAITKITEARCAREMRCENVGADKKYASASECQAEVREEWKDELNARECPGGIVQKELAECLEEIRDENCDNPFDTLGRLAACRESDICKAMVN